MLAVLLGLVMLCVRQTKSERKRMMRIAHIALWTRDLDGTTLFWMRYFGAKVHDAYFIKRRPGFISRFVTLPAGDQIELITAPRIKDPRSAEGVGRDHLAISLGEAAAVDAGGLGSNGTENRVKRWILRGVSGNAEQRSRYFSVLCCESRGAGFSNTLIHRIRRQIHAARPR
jgi:catechol 2,3-dioxygenase-like lactoylglutathione lyase family enzyme